MFEKRKDLASGLWEVYDVVRGVVVGTFWTERAAEARRLTLTAESRWLVGVRS
jgi:hypothetical protein